MLKSLLVIASWLAALSSLTATAHPNHTAPLPPWQAATAWPDRIIATFHEDPSTGFAVTWRTDVSVGRTIVQIAEATPDARFDIVADTYRAKTESVDLETMVTEDGVRHTIENVGLGAAHYHSYVFDGLMPDTLYAWRVQGDRGKWSEWFQTRTAPKDGPVSFVYFGDSQNGVRPNWSRVIRAAFQVDPYATFFLHAGDLVAKGDSDYNWAEWFDAGKFIHAMIPVVPVPGNHENMSVWPDGEDGRRVRTRTTLWRPQFTLPVEKSLPATLHESAYQLRISNDLHVFVVDSARRDFADQAAWLEDALAASDAKWKVVSMHHPYFLPESFDRRADDALRRDAFGPIILEQGVDLVLTGHVHTYSRATLVSRRGPHAARTAGESVSGVGPVFVISVSGAKNTDLWQSEQVDEMVGDGAPDMGSLSLDRVAGNTPMFQHIRIEDDQLTYTAYAATGEAYDGFTLNKSADGALSFVEGDAAFGETRLFENTGPYREWWDLR